MQHKIFDKIQFPTTHTRRQQKFSYNVHEFFLTAHYISWNLSLSRFRQLLIAIGSYRSKGHMDSKIIPLQHVSHAKKSEIREGNEQKSEGAARTNAGRIFFIFFYFFYIPDFNYLMAQ